MFQKVDADGSGEIDYSEFVVATMNEKNLISNNKLQTASKCSIKMVVAPSLRMKLSKFFHSGKILMKRLSTKSLSRLMLTAMVKSPSKNSLK